MKLDPDQKAQLAGLHTCVMTGAFSEAEQWLLALSRRATPALIPFLLPALPPRALWAKHAIFRAPARTASESAFLAKLARLVAECLARASADELTALDEGCRSYNVAPWQGHHHWHQLDAKTFELCLPPAAAARHALISVASFHVSGYVRERAVDLLTAQTTGDELPFLLLRLNDWVAPIQAKALRAVRSRIREDYAPHIARWLRLLLRLLGARRNALSEIVRNAMMVLVTPAGRHALEAQFGAPDPRLRRAAFQLTADVVSGDSRRQLVRRALGDTDAGIRLWAARIALDAGDYLEIMERDPSGVVRLWALRARVERDSAAALPLLQHAVFDRAAGVRGAARFHLARLQPQLSIAQRYRDALAAHDSARVASAISGLAEVGAHDAVATIALHITAPSVCVAKAAIRGCAKLARAEYLPELLRALSDARPGVAKAARVALTGASVPVAQLAELVRAAAYTHTRLNAIALMDGLERWEKLIRLLEAAANDRGEVGAAAERALSRWVFAFERGVYAPSPPRAEQRAEATSLVERLVRVDLKTSLLRALARRS